LFQLVKPFDVYVNYADVYLSTAGSANSLT